MAQYKMTQTATAAGFTIQEVAEATEKIRPGCTFINGDDLWVSGRGGERAAEQAIAKLQAQAESLQRVAHGVVEVTWTKIDGEWVIKGRDLHVGQAVCAVTKSGKTQDVFVREIIGQTPDGSTVARHALTIEAA